MIFACAPGRVLLGALFLATATAAVHAQIRPEPGTTKGLSDDLIVRELMPGIWVHVSLRPDVKGRPVSANGLLVATGNTSILIDTGWNRRQTQRLLDWARVDLDKPVSNLIVTHAHADRMGGTEAVIGQPIIVHGHAYTARLARLYGLPMFHWTFTHAERLNLDGEIVDLLYPGPGHTPDNIVVYLPRRHVLYGGCLIRSTAEESLGFMGDASVKTWPSAVRRVIDRYRDARIVVPGHGPPGGVELLSHTMELLEKAAPPKVKIVQ